MLLLLRTINLFSPLSFVSFYAASFLLFLFLFYIQEFIFGKITNIHTCFEVYFLFLGVFDQRFSLAFLFILSLLCDAITGLRFGYFGLCFFLVATALRMQDAFQSASCTQKEYTALFGLTTCSYMVIRSLLIEEIKDFDLSSFIFSSSITIVSYPLLFSFLKRCDWRPYKQTLTTKRHG